MPFHRHHHPLDTPRYQTELHAILARSDVSESTRKKYALAIDQWILFTGPHPSSWDRNRMSAWRESLLASGKSPETIGMYMSALKHVGKWWAHQDPQHRIDFAIVQPTQLTRTRPQEIRVPLNQQHTEQLINACFSGKPDLYGFRDLVLFIIALDTGMRRKSLAGCRFDKIGTSNGGHGPYPSIEVPTKGRRGTKTFKVPLSETCMLALEAWRDAIDVRRGPVFRRLEKEAKSRGTVIKVRPEGLSEISIYERIVDRAETAKLTDIKVYPHIFRHTFVAWRRENSVDPVLIASVTGHALKDLVGVDIEGTVADYTNKELAGERGRKTTPAWFASLARRSIRQMQELVS